MGAQWSYTSMFEATPLSASQVRAFVLHHLVRHRLQHLSDRIRLVASELSTNALVHAGTDFHVTLSANATAVRLTVRDDNAVLPARRTAGATDSTGRGLEIVSVVSTDWGTDEAGAGSKAVWASFAIG
jgi:hypothetical protein